MGSAASTASTRTKRAAHDLQKSEREIVKLMMPVYYNPEILTADERDEALRAWNMVLSDTAPEYLRLKERGLAYHSSVTFFYDSFYTRLFDIHPMSRQLFKGGMRSQGKFLVQMISLALSEIDDPAKFDKNLVKLAEIHYYRGVKAVEYGVVGEILFWCLRHVLGGSAYTSAVHWVWVKVYSRMLTTIVPVAIAMELKGGSDNSKDRSSHRTSYMFTGAATANQTTTQAGGGSGEDEEEEDNDSLVSEKIRVAEPVEGVAVGPRQRLPSH